MNKIVAWDYQQEIALQLLDKLRENGLAYLAMEERTGKTLVSIIAAEESLASKILVITKKKALEDWESTINNYIHLNSYTVINYESVHKIKDNDFDLIILDEPHAFVSAYPKPSQTWKKVKQKCKGKPIIYSSATPKAEGSQLLFHQFALSDWTPFEEKTYYSFYNKYAKKDEKNKFKTIRIGGGETVIDYTAVDHSKIDKACEHLFIFKTRKELGFKQEPEDVLHYVQVSDSVKNAYNIITSKKALSFTSVKNGKDYDIVCDSVMKLRSTLHMLEGGGVKIKDEYVELANDEKIEYIKKVFGDTDKTVIMYNYVVEGVKLKKHFSKALILQGDTWAEGVDLSDYKDLIIYSQNHRASKHIQRRARQAHRDREEDINVHYILVKGAVSDKIYRDVSIKKRNHTDRMYERIE